LFDFALDNRLLVLVSPCCFSPAGSSRSGTFRLRHTDVADNYVEIITQWPGISAEQIEQQVTIPLESR